MAEVEPPRHQVRQETTKVFLYVFLIDSKTMQRQLGRALGE
jgi:hypothetical protein